MLAPRWHGATFAQPSLLDLRLPFVNNATLAFQKHYEEKLFGDAIECDLLDVDYSEVARALKCGGERVVDPDAIGPALRRALAADPPYVIDVVIDPGARAPIVSLESPGDAVSH